MKISNYFLLAIIAMVISGIKLRSKGNYRYALDSEHYLYIEVLNSGLMGNQRSEYLTDSTNFRIYAGTFDERNSYILYRCKGDKIYIEKKERVNQVFKNDGATAKGKPGNDLDAQYTLKTAYKKIYSLTDLKKQHNYE
jgi:hypothetical protein